jgi:hypothetical protein
MSDYDAADKTKPGEPQDPIDAYDSAHGSPCEENTNANPTNQPDFGPRSFKV